MFYTCFVGLLGRLVVVLDSFGMTDSYRKYLMRKKRKLSRSEYESEHEYNIGTNEINEYDS